MAAADTLDIAELIAPELMDAEVVSALRKAVLLGRLDESRALSAVTGWPGGQRIRYRTRRWLTWLGDYATR